MDSERDYAQIPKTKIRKTNAENSTEEKKATVGSSLDTIVAG